MPRADVQGVLNIIGANVARLRVARGLTQERLAEAADFDVRHLVRIQRGRVGITIEALVRLAAALEVTPVRLLRKAQPFRPRAGRPTGSTPAAQRQRAIGSVRT